MSDKLADIAQRIAANACAALDDVRDGRFPTVIYEQITKDAALIRLEHAETVVRETSHA